MFSFSAIYSDLLEMFYNKDITSLEFSVIVKNRFS